MPIVEFAFSSTITIPSAGSQRKVYYVVFADDSLSRAEGPRHELIDFGRKRDVVGTTLILLLKFGPDIMGSAADRDWFRQFFQAKHRWVVYGNFKDTTNGAYNNLCKCDPPDDEVPINAKYDRENGYRLESEKVF